MFLKVSQGEFHTVKETEEIIRNHPEVHAVSVIDEKKGLRAVTAMVDTDGRASGCVFPALIICTECVGRLCILIGFIGISVRNGSPALCLLRTAHILNKHRLQLPARLIHIVPAQPPGGFFSASRAG